MRLKLAALFSLILHGAVLAAMAWLIAPEIGRQTEPAVVHLNLVTRVSDGDTAAPTDGDLGGQIDQLAAPSPAKRDLTDNPPPPAAAPLAGPLSDPMEYVDPDLRTDIAPGVRNQMPVVTASQTSDPVAKPLSTADERSTLRRIPVTSTQQTMLRKKLDEWIDRIPALLEADAPDVWEHHGQEYSATFQNIPTRDEMGIEKVVVEVGTKHDGERLSSKIHLARLAFSHFGHFIDKWDRDVEMHDDELDGMFHSNSTVYLNFSPDVRPVFRGQATTASGRIAIRN
nr:hypothetical protein [Gammaproteobacteria bacterium]